MDKLNDNCDFQSICDNLIDIAFVKNARIHQMHQSYDTYQNANMLMGYFSQLRDFNSEYESLTEKVSIHRSELMKRYKDILTDEYGDKFKQLLISPTKTEWYRQGIHKYNKVKNYSTYYYRRAIYIELESVSINVQNLKKIIKTIELLDRYYDIYEETIKYFLRTSDRFEQIMRKHFSEYIHL